jgi:hypothetical protein
MEKFVAGQLAVRSVTGSLLISAALSVSYRPFNSSNTAKLCELSPILLAFDKSDTARIIRADFSAVFDTVQRAILLHNVEVSHGFDVPTCLVWLLQCS